MELADACYLHHNSFLSLSLNLFVSLCHSFERIFKAFRGDFTAKEILDFEFSDKSLYFTT